MEYEDCVALATIVRKTTAANQRIPLVNALGRYITREMKMEITMSEWQNLCYNAEEGLPKGIHEQQEQLNLNDDSKPNMDIIIKRAQEKLRKEMGYGVKQVHQESGEESG